MFEPTAEQAAIIEAAVKTKDNLIISALAGAAKTTTLELICRAMPPEPVLSIAFNKRIAEEMAKRLPGHVKAQTINSLGHRVWGAFTRRKLILDKDKLFNLVKAQADNTDRETRGHILGNLGDYLHVARYARMSGYIPSGMPSGKPLMDREELVATLDNEYEVDFDIIDSVLTESIKLSYAGTIDFDDQIYMPTLFGGQFPQFPTVMVDEAQDLSPLNHALLRKLVTKRLIAVGDPWQSIYGFRGSVSSGMEVMKRDYNMKEFPLSVSFRCPQAVVTAARGRVPHMQWAPWAAEGRVEKLTSLSAADIPDGAAIICRNNAPLFKAALDLLGYGRGVKLVGSDLGPSLVRALKKLGPLTLGQEAVLSAIDAWEVETMRKRKRKGAVADKADCLRVFARFGHDLGAAVAYAEKLFSVAGPIQLLSGHKAKGLEWDTVFHLDPWRIPSSFAIQGTEEYEQELNVRYVIETRAKKELFRISLEGLRA